MVCSAVRNNNGNYPNGFLVDFEAAAINAIRNILPRTDISGCFFHLLPNLWKHVQRAGLRKRYMNDPQFGSQSCMIATLGFVPPQDLVNSFDELCVVIRNHYDGDVEERPYYFKDSYIGCFRRNAPDVRLYFLWSYGTCSI